MKIYMVGETKTTNMQLLKLVGEAAELMDKMITRIEKMEERIDDLERRQKMTDEFRRIYDLLTIDED